MPCAQSDKVGASAHDAMLAALEVTLGNIKSLGPAGALDSVPMPYKIWAQVVHDAIEKARAMHTDQHGYKTPTSPPNWPFGMGTPIQQPKPVFDDAPF